MICFLANPERRATSATPSCCPDRKSTRTCFSLATPHAVGRCKQERSYSTKAKFPSQPMSRQRVQAQVHITVLVETGDETQQQFLLAVRDEHKIFQHREKCARVNENAMEATKQQQVVDGEARRWAWTTQ